MLIDALPHLLRSSYLVLLLTSNRRFLLLF